MKRRSQMRQNAPRSYRELGMDFTRTLVIGNSGSGKSWLSERLADSLDATWTDLDLIHWQSGGFNVARQRTRQFSLLAKQLTPIGGSSKVYTAG